ncbi:MAG: prepilin peptidase [Tissierellia bacterium]|nr:prepilin peptidase [Tissierellia bacterium]
MVWIICFLLIGMVLGSFYFTVYWRRENNISLVKPRSFCPHCHRPLSWSMMVPGFSYFILKGRCAYCYQKIGKETVFFEWGYGIVTAIFLYYYGFTPINTIRLLQLHILILLSYTDFKSQNIYTMDLGLLLFLELLIKMYEGSPIIASLIYGLLFALVFYILMITTGGMGQGDVEMAFVCGFFAKSLYELFLLFEFAFIMGGLVSLSLILFRIKNRKDKIAFGPFLAIALCLVYVWR